MPRQFVIFTLALVLPTLVVCGTAHGWAGPTHATLCQETFDDSVVSPLLSGIDQSAIENYTGEPPGDWHSGQWTKIQSRDYLNWTSSLSETTALQYLQHNTTDVGVPLGHSPANQVYTNTIAEAILEAQVATWATHPSVEGTTSYTHNRNGHSYNFTGNIYDVIDTFEDACLDNASWFKSTRNWFGLHSIDDNRDAGWNGTTIGLMLQRAVMVDYFLAKENPVVLADQYVTGTAGGYITFDHSTSYDPDAVIWNSNGTYSQSYGCDDENGMDFFLWDFNADVPSGSGAWDWGAYDDTITLPVNDLIAFGCPVDQWNVYYVYGQDNEGKAWADGHWFYLSSGGAAVPEPATIGMLLMGAMALLLNRRRRS
ncbi:MAG: PEP-CTERM sorting domain-containing protein [Pirellulales bacterium]|nr:PEP-CTERM sorting domain-containing protein [Pirellulales bacterium]